jgi:hypothetical protein
MSAPIKHELAQAVFNSVYRSHAQRLHRLAAAVLLFAVHTLRGLLFSWPLYLMAIAGFYTSRPVSLLLWAIAVPGIALSFAILARGVRAEYRERIAGRIQKRGDLVRLLKGGSTS